MRSITSKIKKDKNLVKANGSTPGSKANKVYEPFSMSPKTNPPKNAPYGDASPPQNGDYKGLQGYDPPI